MPLASEVVPSADLSTGESISWQKSWPGVVGRLCRHERLTARDAGGNEVDVDWVVLGDVDHVCGEEGTARALAWRLGSWERRHEILAPRVPPR